MSEKISSNNAESLNSARCEAIILDHIDEIELYLNIFKQLPKDLASAAKLQSEYCRETSLIVITDESSWLGKKAAEYMFDNIELEQERDSDNPPDITVGILNREDIESNVDFFGKAGMKLTFNSEQRVNVAVISDETMVISLPLPE